MMFFSHKRANFYFGKKMYPCHFLVLSNSIKKMHQNRPTISRVIEEQTNKQTYIRYCFIKVYRCIWAHTENSFWIPKMTLNNSCITYSKPMTGYWRKGLLLKMQPIGIKEKSTTGSNPSLPIDWSRHRWMTPWERTLRGSCLSCTLFLVFLKDISKILKTEIALFADDLVMWHTGDSTIIS